MKKVCIIDDEPQSVEILREFVLTLGYEPEGYSSAAAFFSNHPDGNAECAILLDLNMPDMDGIEVIRQLAVRKSSAALVLMSGYDSSVLRAAEKLALAHNLKVIGSLTKPVSLSLLESLFEEINHNDRPHFFRGERFPPLQLSELRDALAGQQIILHYQPQIDIGSGKLTGVEALVRWQHPERGLIFPDQIIPMVEKFGLMGSLTALVIDQAVRQSRQWQEMGLDIHVSVNIAAEDIASLTFPEQLTKLLHEHQFDLSMLTLEITESELMGDLRTSLDVLTRLRMKGVELSIDDFGTGYSSLSQLHKIPFSELKIDMSFVMNMCKDDEAMAIVNTCIMLGHALKMKVVAEGVESERILNHLKEMSCDIAQGYYFARPMDAKKLLQWVSQRGK